jgi:hypothetical protein
LDEDVLRVAKSVARQRGLSLGRVLSDYFRAGLRQSETHPNREVRNGVPLLPTRPGSQPVTPELVKELLEADE